RLARVTEVGLAFLRQLSRLRERDEVRANVVAPLVARREPERREHPGGLGHEHRLDLELVREFARMDRARTAEGDEREVARIVAALDRDDSEGSKHLRIDDLDDGQRVDVAERTLGRAAVEAEP